jgi:ferredoxin
MELTTRSYRPRARSPFVKVTVDAELCTGHGRCYALAPDVFAPDDYGHCEVILAEPTGDLAELARTGARNCPESAITVTE